MSQTYGEFLNAGEAKQHRVLIANRGEIARRIIRTCKALGIETVSIYTTVDALAPHVREATVAIPLGDNPREYTNAARLVQIAVENGCTAVHPGYGFLSENEAFMTAITEAGVTWLGPTAKTMHDFSLKHVAREIAKNAGVPILEGSGLVTEAKDAVHEAQKVGYPVLLKATGGGGGMGIFLCRNDADVARQFEMSRHQGQAFFGNAGVFVEKYIEKAHHVEVQIFGDGEGGCIHLGERECSIQRRHQKVLEETPSPLVDSTLRQQLTSAAVALGAASAYRSAGTVEFLVDEESRQFYFLEVNTRLQVEHGITEMAHGNIDIVEAQLRLQLAGLLPEGGAAALLESLASAPATGCAIEVRINGEDPAHDFSPCPGLLGHVSFPSLEQIPGVRVDSWVETGTEVSPHYDSLLAKLMVWAPTREEAVARMVEALAKTELQGFHFVPHVAEVLVPGMQTSVQDWPGRTRLWHVGVPPSGPMDSLSHRLANALVGNEEGAAALEFSLQGPTLRFHCPALVALTGAPFAASLDGQPLEWGSSFRVEGGQVLAVGQLVGGVGVRGYLAVRGGIQVPSYLGSRSTFPGGKFGGYQGRYLRVGDSLPLAKAADQGAQPTKLPPALAPAFADSGEGGKGASWSVGVISGPHADPDFITPDFMEIFHSSPYKVHYQSNRLGVRLVGPKPEWVRPDGGEGGTHPSNVHDHIYAIGAINFTGDHPVVLTVDGPSLGGFVCPATITSTELWKIGQVRPDDSVTFVRLSLTEALADRLRTDARVASVRAMATEGLTATAALASYEKAAAAAWETASSPDVPMPPTKALCRELPAKEDFPGAQYRLAGDRYVQVDYGPMALDIRLRVRVHCLRRVLDEMAAAGELPGLVETSPGVRSCMVEYDIAAISPGRLLQVLEAAEARIPEVSSMVLPSRIVNLPMAFDERWTKEAIAKYMKSVRPSAPYLPDNIAYIAENNGLAGGKEEVRDKVFSASYLVLGLGDVYLGAPCAVPMDPRHRLVTTKMNPARTFTAEGTVGIGGSYMCIYPMDSPGGYQLVGRTLPIWNTFGRSGPFTPAKPWLLDFFDQVRFFHVTESELESMRTGFANGTYDIEITATTFDVSSFTAMEAAVAAETAEFKAKQRAAMDHMLVAEAESLAELAEAAAAAGKDSAAAAAAVEDEDDESMYDKPGHVKVTAAFSANVWDVRVSVGQTVAAGDTLVVLEAMKMETPLTAPVAGRVVAIRAKLSQLAASGDTLVVIDSSSA
ncbi:hypothetical protein VOLCADRAFT_98356 [Volvox carteri f. nagariensis]|uniref:Uncharacterized protein n=1 Tax=Volvox carteri f. nagariensis TaxID=3068 RepID=D8UF47_VOLCA|nr:uncharacterized protein VOLCADRAFT_98356 [Volvox carteri f. nagariensis]EFJ41655.1 hypothetical protein VOLCADRAFT_98356 [Volvox carteri f. nagariensis]|eukprot:XP_002957311.1 hypothetical protein VOLCADRAFT_98356 [Volvox carteri f. nagariensis]